MPKVTTWGRWLRESPSGLVPLAVAIGATTGLGAVGFRWLVTAFTRMFTGHDDYSGLGRVASTHWPWLGFWFLLIAPVVAGAVYGPLVHRFAPEARGHGVPEVMYAVSHRGGRIAPQVSLVKALASALCIGGGGSVGREGPIVQIGSAAGSTLAQVLRLDTSRMRLLVACGAAAGISATFNAPLAGPFFAMELILRDFAAQSFGAVVLSSVTADIVGRAILGDHPFLTLPSFAVHSPSEYLLYGALGVVVGAVGVAFSKVLYLVEDACDWAWRGPEWARPAVGGVLLGGLLIAVPQMYGVGYPVLENAVEGRYVIGMLLLLMVAKMFATSLTIGIGGSGGVFAPTLFIGAMAGTAFGTVAHGLFPGATESAGAYGLIGMGAALGGATGAPITAVVILFELTGEYSIILPLMAGVVMAAGTGHLLSKTTIYTAKLWRRGVDLDAPPSRDRRNGSEGDDVNMDMDTAPLGASTWLTTWTSSPVADTLIAVALIGYLTLLIRARRQRISWPPLRSVAAIAAAVLLVLVVNSALAVYGHHLFWVHMIVHLLLITVVPALLVWAQPIRLLRDVGGAAIGGRVDHIRHTRAFRLLISPRFTVPLYAAVLILTHLTGFQQAMSVHEWIHDAELVLYLVSGYLLLLPLVGDELTTDPPLPHLLKFVIVAVCMFPDTLVGIMLMMTSTALAPAYAASRDWGPSALVDQATAGAIMWFGGDGLMMVLMVVIGGRWISRGDRADASLGPWLDRVRRGATLGMDDDGTDIDGTDIDDDDAALAAYNARLAALHQRSLGGPPR